MPRPRISPMGSPSWRRMQYHGEVSPGFQPDILERRRERIARDEADPGLLHPRPDAAEAGDQPDRGKHHLLMDELLDAVQGRLASFRLQLGRLFAEEPIDVGVAPVSVRAASGDERLDPRGGVAKGAAAALDEALVLLVGITSEEGRPLERAELHPDADGGEIVDDGLG